MAISNLYHRALSRIAMGRLPAPHTQAGIQEGLIQLPPLRYQDACQLALSIQIESQKLPTELVLPLGSIQETVNVV